MAGWFQPRIVEKSEWPKRLLAFTVWWHKTRGRSQLSDVGWPSSCHCAISTSHYPDRFRGTQGVHLPPLNALQSLNAPVARSATTSHRLDSLPADCGDHKSWQVQLQPLADRDGARAHWLWLHRIGYGCTARHAKYSSCSTSRTADWFSPSAPRGR